MRAVATRYGLGYPVRGEPWHVEPMARGGYLTVHRQPADNLTTLNKGWNLVDNRTGGPETWANVTGDRRAPLIGTVNVTERSDLDVLAQQLEWRFRRGSFT
jgi:hypothetical protein